MAQLEWKHKTLSLVQLFSNVFMPSRQSGYIRALFVKEGDYVEQGQKLLEVKLENGSEETLCAPEGGFCRILFHKANIKNLINGDQPLMMIEISTNTAKEAKRVGSEGSVGVPVSSSSSSSSSLAAVTSPRALSSSSGMPGASTSLTDFRKASSPFLLTAPFLANAIRPPKKQKAPLTNALADLYVQVDTKYESLNQLLRKKAEIEASIQKHAHSGGQAEWRRDIRAEIDSQIADCRRELLTIFKHLSYYQRLKFSGQVPYRLKMDIKEQHSAFVPRIKIDKSVRDLPRHSAEFYSILGRDYNKHSFLDHFYGHSTSTYPYMEYKNSREGEPICDHYRAVITPNYQILTMADGCNWGLAPATAAIKAAKGFTKYVTKMLPSVFDAQKLAAVAVTGLFEAHNNILRGVEVEGRAIGTTTLMGAIVCKIDPSFHNKSLTVSYCPNDLNLPSVTLLDDPPSSSSSSSSSTPSAHVHSAQAQGTSVAMNGHNTKDTSSQSQITERKMKLNITKPWLIVLANIGDCKAFVYNRSTDSVVELTPDRRQNASDATDCGGRLGPYIDGGPDMRNLSVYYSFCEADDIVILCTDGVHDNFDAEFIGKLPKDVSPSHNTDWDQLDSDIAENLKSQYRCMLMRELMHARSEELKAQTPSCKILTTSLIDHCMKTVKSSQSFLQENTGRRLPKDYVEYPGKLDHTTLIASRVGDVPSTDYSMLSLKVQRKREKLKKAHPLSSSSSSISSSQGEPKIPTAIDDLEIDSLLDSLDSSPVLPERTPSPSLGAPVVLQHQNIEENRLDLKRRLSFRTPVPVSFEPSIPTTLFPSGSDILLPTSQPPLSPKERRQLYFERDRLTHGSLPISEIPVSNNDFPSVKKGGKTPERKSSYCFDEDDICMELSFEDVERSISTLRIDSSNNLLIDITPSSPPGPSPLGPSSSSSSSSSSQARDDSPSETRRKRRSSSMENASAVGSERRSSSPKSVKRGTNVSRVNSKSLCGEITAADVREVGTKLAKSKNSGASKTPEVPRRKANLGDLNGEATSSQPALDGIKMLGQIQSFQSAPNVHLAISLSDVMEVVQMSKTAAQCVKDLFDIAISSLPGELSSSSSPPSSDDDFQNAVRTTIDATTALVDYSKRRGIIEPSEKLKVSVVKFVALSKLVFAWTQKGYTEEDVSVKRKKLDRLKGTVANHVKAIVLQAKAERHQSTL